MSLSGFATTHRFANALRRVGILALLLAGPKVMAQPAETAKEGRPNEVTVGAYQVLTIDPRYDIRMSDEMVKLDEMYTEDYKSLTTEQKAVLRDAKKVSSEARARRTEALKTIRKVLAGEQSVEQNRARMDYWFKRIVFPEMTQLDTKSLSELPELRSTFARDYFQRAQKSPAAHAYLTQTAFAELKYIAENNFHPAVRYHAVLMIGQLNSSEAVLLGSPKSPPVPYQPALDYLLSVYQDDKQIEAARVAALLGISRHAELLGAKMPEEDRNKVIDTMLTTLDAEPGNRTAEGHAWIQRRAIEVLGIFQNVGAGGKVAQKLRDILEDETASVAMRCAAAVAYGKLDFPGEVDPKAARVAAVVGQLVANVCRSRLDWLALEQEALKERRQANSGYGETSSEASSYGEGAEGGIIVPIAPSASGGESSSYTEIAPGPPGGGYEESYGTSEEDRERMATELELHRLQALRRRIKYPVFCAQIALGAKLERGTIRLPTDHGLRRYLKDKDESDFVDELARQLNKLQDAANAGIKKKEEVNPRSAPSSFVRTPEVKPADIKLPTEEFKEALLVAVRKVEETLRKAPPSVRPVVTVPEEPAVDETIDGPGPPAGPAPIEPPAGPPGPAAGPDEPPVGPAAPAAGPAPEAGPAPDAGPAVPPAAP